MGVDKKKSLELDQVESVRVPHFDTLSSSDTLEDIKNDENNEYFSDFISARIEEELHSYSLRYTNLSSNTYIQSTRFSADIIFVAISYNVFKFTIPIITTAIILSTLFIPNPINEIVVLALAAPLSVSVVALLSKYLKK